jgi:hypothetical protein
MFGRSDVGFIVTFAQLPVSTIGQKLDWLVRLLGAARPLILVAQRVRTRASVLSDAVVHEWEVIFRAAKQPSVPACRSARSAWPVDMSTDPSVYLAHEREPRPIVSLSASAGVRTSSTASRQHSGACQPKALAARRPRYPWEAPVVRVARLILLDF